MAEYMELAFSKFNEMTPEAFDTFVRETINVLIFDSSDELYKKMAGQLTTDELFACQKALEFITEQIFGALSDTITLKMLLDKIKGINPDKKEVVYNQFTKNLEFIQRKYVEKLIAGSNYYLDDFNWNLDICLSSNSLSQMKVPLLQVEFILKKIGVAETKKVLLEFTREDLDAFLEKLSLLENKL